MHRYIKYIDSRTYIYTHISHKRIITDNHQEWATMFYPAMKRINFFWQTTRCERRNSFDHVGQSHIAGKRFPVLRLNCRFFSGQPVDILQSSPKRFKKMYHQNIREKDVFQSFRDDIPTIFLLDPLSVFGIKETKKPHSVPHKIRFTPCIPRNNLC